MPVANLRGQPGNLDDHGVRREPWYALVERGDGGREALGRERVEQVGVALRQLGREVAQIGSPGLWSDMLAHWQFLSRAAACPSGR